MSTSSIIDPKGRLTDRWYPLIAHPKQRDLWFSTARFNIACAGRRSGKTERAKRKLVAKGLNYYKFSDGLFVASAPTRDQAKRIYWSDLKKMVPTWALAHQRPDKDIRESDLSISLFNGATIAVVGLDRPTRIEGVPVDFIILDEYADMKPETWGQSIRPSLSTMGRPGEAWFIGKPRGRNHYYDRVQKAQEHEKNILAEFGNLDRAEWRYFHWTSEEILPPDEIASAKEDLDQISYDQEYRASFVTFEGKCYYTFNYDIHATDYPRYDPEKPIHICFDFNVDPGVAVICQESTFNGPETYMAPRFTACLDEVYLEGGSNTVRVCQEILNKWGAHQAEVYCYGDATGGARKTAAVEGSDWTLVRKVLSTKFDGRLFFRVPRKNPPERDRVNALNARMMSISGAVRMLINKRGCPHLIKDLDGVITDPSGAIDKNYDKRLTHISDALGYYTHYRFPLDSRKFVSKQA